MRTLLGIIFVFIGVTFSYSCSKEIPASKKNYVGNWVNQTNAVTLLIQQSGEATYTNNIPGRIDYIDGLCKIKDNYIRICMGTRCAKYTFNKGPTTGIFLGKSGTYLILEKDSLIKQ